MTHLKLHVIAVSVCFSSVGNRALVNLNTILHLSARVTIIQKAVIMLPTLKQFLYRAQKWQLLAQKVVTF